MADTIYRDTIVIDGKRVPFYNHDLDPYLGISKIQLEEFVAASQDPTTEPHEVQLTADGIPDGEFSDTAPPSGGADTAR